MSKSLKIFSIILVLLAGTALLVGEKRTNNPEDLALTFSEYDALMLSPVSSITPLELAEFLMKQEHHYNLIDLQGDGTSYQLPTAEALSVDSFLKKNIPVNETIILYGKNETAALQLYYLLLIRGYFKVQVLQGGMTQWFSEILRPRRSAIAEEDVEYRREITEFFGGMLVMETDEGTEFFNPPSIHLEKKHKEHGGC